MTTCAASAASEVGFAGRFFTQIWECALTDEVPAWLVACCAERREGHQMPIDIIANEISRTLTSAQSIETAGMPR